MKLVITLLLLSSTLSTFSQATESIANSFEMEYQKSNPDLIYSYDNISQIHDYSNNWDFDKDGIKDELYFVGTGGAHLYFFLKIILSKDKKSRELNFLESDFPFLTATDTINFNESANGFVVTDLGKNLTTSIIVRLDDQSFYVNKKLLAKKDVKTKNVLIRFEKGKTKYGSL